MGREHFGDLHGFIAGWCYWTNSLFYVPVLLVYIAGVVAFAGGDRSVGLVDDKGSWRRLRSGGWRSSPSPTFAGWPSASGSTTSAAPAA